MNQQDAFEMVMSMYVGEPCRICGKKLTRDDLRSAIWAGYSKDNKARVAHEECWNKIPNEEWVHQ